jgi:hypothetical protein
MNIDVKHKLGNFHLAIALAPSDEQLSKLIALGVKKATDGAASPFFKGIENRRDGMPYSDAKAEELRAALQEKLGAFGSCTVSVSAREWTDGKSKAAEIAAAKARYEAAIANPAFAGLDKALIAQMSGYVLPAEQPSNAPATATVE